MPFTTEYKKWDIVLVSFPFTDFTSDKRRPALVISPNNYNLGSDVVILFVTSQLANQPRIGDYRIKFWKEAGMPKESLVRMKFATVDKTIIVKRLGQLENQDRLGLEEILLSFFGS